MRTDIGSHLVSMFASILFTQQKYLELPAILDYSLTWENLYCNGFDHKKGLQSVMRTDIGSHLGTTILSLALMGSVGSLDFGIKGLRP